MRLADPEVANDPSEYQQIAKSVAELDEVQCSFMWYRTSRPWQFVSLTYSLGTVGQVVSVFQQYKDTLTRYEESKGSPHVMYS